MDALTDVLSRAGESPEVFAFYGQVPAQNYDSPTLFVGALANVRELIDRFGSAPSNLWPTGRSWFVMTDWDITSTCVWGSGAVVEGVRRHPDIEAFDWSPPQDEGR